MSTRIPLGLLIAACLLIAAEVHAQTPGRRRAVLIGINDYSASRLGKPPFRAVPERAWRNLEGAATDAKLLDEMLPLIYGFESGDVVTLLDQSATRGAILHAIEDNLLKPARAGDTLLFYFAGHGSQVRNSLSSEPDKLDETIVPADSRLGARDIRDKELRLLFNRILDRGARLTVILDNCNSGSGARGLTTGLRPRGVKTDTRDVADGAYYGPRPEERGALVLAATQDFDTAWETRDSQGRFHGAFTWALLRAMREADADEPAIDTFLRAQARLRAATPYQEPVIAGNAASRLDPLLARRTDRRAGDRAIVAVEKVREDGTIILQGGWANGLDVGTELRVATESRVKQNVVVSAIEGLSRSEARLESNDRNVPLAIHSGALLEVVGWAAPAGRAMRVSMPRVALDVEKLTELAVAMRSAATKHRIAWIADPQRAMATRVLRRAITGWQVVDGEGEVEAIGRDDAAVAAIAKLPAGSSIFVQFPAPAAIVDGMQVGVGTDCEGIEPVDSPESADYVLVGRYSGRKIAYSWMRPLVKNGDRRKTGLPEKTRWLPLDGRKDSLRETLAELQESALTLRRIHAWQILESPQRARSPYRLALRRERDDEIVEEDAGLTGGEKYGLLLRARHMPLAEPVVPRYMYVFVIDSNGNSELLFPFSSVENRLPQPPVRAEIVLNATFTVQEPYGLDTYFLLTTDEPLPNPFVLKWTGVRTRAPEELSPLEQLLALTGTAGRSGPFITPTTWSIERLVCESSAPRKRAKK